MLTETASQTAGPYLHIGMVPQSAGIDARGDERWQVLASEGAQGERIRLEGMIFDGTGSVVRDALVEIWQADAHGKHNHPEDRQDKPADPAFRGFGRAAADFKTGLWWFETVKPGKVPGRHGTTMAPHVNVTVFARGINIHLNTRIYFADEAEANAQDPVLRLVEQEARRQTLLARREERGGRVVYRFDMRLQGENETVFFDV
ncbi:MAG TPA: protocatechuate 3,4-dioxygenase subunit alpha [Geminicoccaceae bacterium]|jgi:protocatechuate 3,4-dioxygenase alpha subunit|nr:protocatechuate 3,4-dioxygenase subunit alpha [Geminicoccaceae bacterium]